MTASKILLVDDEVNILNALKRLLISEDFEITLANSPFEALHLASQEEFAIVLSDHRMPHMEGTTLLQKVKEISPASIRIMLTGYADLPAATSAINEGEVYRFLSKPWDDEELIKVLKQAVKQFETGKEQQQAHIKNEKLKEKNQELAKKNLEEVFQRRRLYEELDQSYMVSIQALTRSMKFYDSRMWHHTLNVKLICQTIAKLIGLSRENTTQLEVAALLHDIGRMGIPHTILRKPKSELKPEELELFQAAPFNGYSIVSMIPHFQEAALFILHYRESFDGTGYPGGLKGLDIPTGSRIIAVADAYVRHKKGQNLLVMDASYQEALSHLEKESGKRFDPDAIALLKECIASHSGQFNPTWQGISTQWQQAVASEKERLSAESASIQSTLENPAFQPEQTMRFEEPGILQNDLETLDTVSTSFGSIEYVADTDLQETESQPIELVGETNWEFLKELSSDAVSSKVDGMKADVSQENVASHLSSQSQSPSLRSIPIAPVNHPKEFMAKQNHAVAANNPTASYAPISGKILKNAYAPSKQKYKEVVISPSFLCVGMVLSRDLINEQGAKLLQKGTVIHPEQLAGIKSYVKRNGLEEMEIYILKPC